MTTKARGYCYTLNNYTADQYDAIQKIESVYHVGGEEVAPSTGTPHIQGFIYFKNPRAFKSVHKDLFNAHLEPLRGTPEEASVYCKKENKFFEIGDCPKQGRRTDVEIVREQIKDGNGMRGVVSVATNLQQIKLAEAILRYEEPKRDWKPHCVWVHGPTGTGKSKWAHDQFADTSFYRKSGNTGKWWDGYDAHENVIIDDIDRKTFDYKNMLDLLDRYSCQVEVKGTTRQFLAKRIIITCSISPMVMFGGENQCGAELLRRLDRIIYIGKNGLEETPVDFYVEQAKTQHEAQSKDYD